MTSPTVSPYGAWHSSISPDLIVAGTVGLSAVVVDGDDVYWLESRPAEAGRSVLVRYDAGGRTSDLTPPPFNVRDRVHEYGGGAYTVAGGSVIFSHFADNRLYRIDGNEAPHAITAEGAWHYADLVLDRQRQRVICVREDHGDPSRETVNTIVAVNADGDRAGGRVLVEGNDFYAAPRLSPDGSHLAWLTWNHPNMPWDGSELWLGEIADDGSIGHASRIAGGATESICQPEWSSEGELYFVSDASDWWNLYRWGDGAIDALCPMAAEFSGPQWVFGLSTYALLGRDRLVCTYGEEGQARLATLDLTSGSLNPVPLDATALESIRAAGNRAVLCAGSPTRATAVVRVDVDTGETDTLRQSSVTSLDPADISVPRAIEFPTEHGLTAYGFFYPPTNRTTTGPEAERPPLLVQSHGGPTSGTSTDLDLEVQYWTNRGFAVLDVNYDGSTGFGRPYRQRLDGQWGIVDVDDCVNGARYLAAEGLVDPNRLVIRGWSASGYTTLAALAFRDVFTAGASHFGVSDLETMTGDTRKFESRYLDRLIGPYPERIDRYRERSPIHFIDQIEVPLILFQGLDDKVVPPEQAELLFNAMRDKGLPVAYVPFAGEGHGFRRGDSITRALEAELSFYAQIFGFSLPEPIAPVEIANLATPATTHAD